MSRMQTWLERVWEKHQGHRPEIESREERAMGLREARRALVAARDCNRVVQRLTGQIERREVDDLAPKIVEAFQVAPRRERS